MRCDAMHMMPPRIKSLTRTHAHRSSHTLLLLLLRRRRRRAAQVRIADGAVRLVGLGSDARVTTPDVAACAGGVVHIVDELLLPIGPGAAAAAPSAAAAAAAPSAAG
jgi:hypothetical protein